MPDKLTAPAVTTHLKFTCPHCAWLNQNLPNTLESKGESIGSVPLRSDRVDCAGCGKEIFIFQPQYIPLK